MLILTKDMLSSIFGIICHLFFSDASIMPKTLLTNCSYVLVTADVSFKMLRTWKT